MSVLLVQVVLILILVQNGVERGDVLDELCGEPVLASTHGKVNPILAVICHLYPFNIICF